MSRIGKQPVGIPSGVEVIIDGRKVTTKGPKGTLEVKLPLGINVELKENTIVVSPFEKRRSLAATWGLSRALLANMVNGVATGFTKVLEFEGVGYRATVKGNDLELNLGYSHPITVNAPEGITFQADKASITVSGIDKQMVGEIAAQIRRLRKPEPYKGSGIRYKGERIIRKSGKKAAGATA